MQDRPAKNPHYPTGFPLRKQRRSSPCPAMAALQPARRLFRALGIGSFGLVSSFDIRISSLPDRVIMQNEPNFAGPESLVSTCMHKSYTEVSDCGRAERTQFEPNLPRLGTDATRARRHGSRATNGAKQSQFVAFSAPERRCTQKQSQLVRISRPHARKRGQVQPAGRNVPVPVFRLPSPAPDKANWSRLETRGRRGWCGPIREIRASRDGGRAVQSPGNLESTECNPQLCHWRLGTCRSVSK